MQSFNLIQSTDQIQDSREKIVNNDLTVMSCSSGTLFPTQNLQVGMLCLRTDLNQLYQLKNAVSNIWVLIADLNKTYIAKDYVDTQVTALSNNKLNISGGSLTGGLGLIQGWGLTSKPFGWSGIDLNNSRMVNGVTRMQFNSANTIWSNEVYDDGTWYKAWDLRANGDTYIRGNKVWHQGNDGNGSGLDADTVRGFKFNWSGQGGQPTWLLGGINGTDIYVYNPSNFSVNYASSAGSAGTVAGANVTGTVANANYANSAGSANSVLGSNVSGTVANASYANSAGNANTVGGIQFRISGETLQVFVNGGWYTAGSWYTQTS